MAFARARTEHACADRKHARAAADIEHRRSVEQLWRGSRPSTASSSGDRRARTSSPVRCATRSRRRPDRRAPTRDRSRDRRRCRPVPRGLATCRRRTRRPRRVCQANVPTESLAASVIVSRSSPSDVHNSIMPATPRSSMATTPSDHSTSEASSTSSAVVVTTSASTNRDVATRCGTARHVRRRSRRRAAMSSRRARPSLMTAGVPTASAPDGTMVSLRTTALAATIAPLCTTTRCSTIDPLPIRHHGSMVHPSRCTRWPITQSSPTVVGCFEGGVQHAVVLHARALADEDLAVVAAKHGAGPDRAVGADRDGADHHGIGMHVGVGMDGRDLVTEGVDGHV